MQVKRARTPHAAAPSEWITGNAWVNEISSREAPSRLQVDAVRFSQGARTVWHTHPLGQLLHIVEGVGRVQRRGGPVEILQVGDSVRIAPGEWHWHGAGPASSMTHLAIEEISDDGAEPERGAAVSDAEYLGTFPVA